MPRECAAPFAKVDAYRAGNAARTDAKMAIEPFVLGRDDRILEMWRNRISSDDPTELIAPPCKDLTLMIHERDRATGPTIQHLFHFGHRIDEVGNRTRQDQTKHQSATPRYAPNDAKDRTKHAIKNAGNKTTFGFCFT